MAQPVLHPAATFQVLQIILMGIYVIFALILLLNLLIAMMNDTYKHLNENVDARWYCERVSMMLFFETEFTVKEMEQIRINYSERAWQVPRNGRLKLVHNLPVIDKEWINLPPNPEDRPLSPRSALLGAISKKQIKSVLDVPESPVSSPGLSPRLSRSSGKQVTFD